MLKEFEFFHGVVFARILHGGNAPVNIKSYPNSDNASYVINDKAGIYIKYSSKLMSPWRFSFQKEYQDEILKMKNEFGEIYVVLVCNDDGIVCLNFDELKEVLDTQHDTTEWISVARGPREKYEVKGHDGDLRLKIGNSDFPDKIFKSVKIKSGIFSWLM
jgi:hypothetical protein